MAVADTAYSILDNPTTSGGGGGGGTDLHIISSRNTIEVEREGDTVDLNVAGEDSIQIYVTNLDELLGAVKFVGEKFVQQDSTSCVISIMKNIDMTSPTQAQAAQYTVNGNSLVDLQNKTYKFGKYLRNTRIVSEGSRRILQLLYPVYSNGSVNHMDSWSIEVEHITMNNTDLGGGCASWESITNHPASIPKNTPIQLSRYLVKSNGNCSYYFENCSFPVCGANQNDNSYNPFIQEGSGDNRPTIYHTNISLVNCYFYHGSDSTGSMYNHTNAPIVIDALYHGAYQKKLVLIGLRKDINNTSKETGVPNIQIRSNQSQSSYPWQITSDGTALVSHQYGESSLVLKSRVAVNDVLIQGQPTLQPEGATNTYDWVSLTEELNKRKPLNITDDNSTTPVDTDKVLYQHSSESGNVNFIRTTLSRFWEWIKGKADNRYFARFDFVNMPNNSFMSEQRYFSSQLNDRLWAADQRLNVTWRGYSSETDEEIYDKDTTAYRLFLGEVGMYAAHPVTGEYDIIKIKSKTEGANMWTYNNGKLILSFYGSSVPPTPPVIRTYGGSTAQWTTLGTPSNPIASVYVYTMPTGANSLYLKEIEIKVQGRVPGSDPNTAGACLSSVVFIGERSSVEQESLVTKHAIAQQLYGELTAKKLITRGGTSSQVVAGDGSLLSYPASPLNNGGEMTQLAYDNMGSHDPNTIYIITD